MAELSDQTKAIVERLKAEGQLVRNTGTNSIRSVKVQLDRFEGIFDTISSNVIEQTSMMRTQLGIAQESIERQKTKEQFEELQPPSTYDEESSTSPSKDTDAKINEMGDRISEALSFKNIALAAGGLFVGYNILKGFIDEKTGGGFTEMENMLKEADFSAIGDALGSIEWATFASSINNMSTKLNDFSKWLDETGIGDIAGAVAGSALVYQGARGAVAGAMAGRTGFKGKLAGIGPGIAMATAGLALYYGDEVKSAIEGMGVKEEDSETVKNLAVGALTIGSMFGPAGMIVGAAAAAAITVGGMITGYISDVKAEQKKQFDEDVARSNAIIEQAQLENRDLYENELEEVAKTLSEARRRQQLALTVGAMEDAEKAAEAAREALAQQTVVDGGTMDQFQRLADDVLGGKEGAMDELLAYAQNREADRGFFSRKFGGTSEEWIDEFLKDFGEDMIRERMVRDAMNGGGAYDHEKADQMMEAWNTLMNARGAAGSGAPVYSGRGNLTSQQISDMFNTPSFRFEGGSSGAFARYVQRQAEAGFVSESPVIINAPTYSNPVINAPVGPTTFQNTVLGQTLSGSNSGDIYGLPK